MAYAEKRGKGPRPWRVKYRTADGTEASEPGFETKNAALTWGRDQEAQIRARRREGGRQEEPRPGTIKFEAWVERWKATQDVGLSTTDNRDYLLRRFILPHWTGHDLDSITTEEVLAWEKAIPADYGVSARTASDARSLLGTILGDAVTAKPPVLSYNPALRPRNRGRRTGRRLARSPQRAWATPLQALLLAERAALLSGHDSDFILLLTIGYTGM